MHRQIVREAIRDNFKKDYSQNRNQAGVLLLQLSACVGTGTGIWALGTGYWYWDLALGTGYWHWARWEWVALDEV